jgi:hypothetical protein
MPPITVDNLGPYIDGKRAELATPEGPKRLKEIVAGLPLVPSEEVVLVTLKKAKTKDVAAVIQELGAAGATKIRVKTNARDDMPQELVVVPSVKAKGLAPCSVVALIGEDLQTRVWAIKGGTAKLSKKGFAGPDYTLTAVAAKKDIAACASDTALFSGEPAVEWELTFNLGGALLSQADVDKKLKVLVYLEEPPVGGRPVKLP